MSSARPVIDAQIERQEQQAHELGPGAQRVVDAILLAQVRQPRRGIGAREIAEHAMAQHEIASQQEDETEHQGRQLPRVAQHTRTGERHALLHEIEQDQQPRKDDGALLGEQRDRKKQENRAT